MDDSVDQKIKSLSKFNFGTNSSTSEGISKASPKKKEQQENDANMGPEDSFSIIDPNEAVTAVFDLINSYPEYRSRIKYILESRYFNADSKDNDTSSIDYIYDVKDGIPVFLDQKIARVMQGIADDSQSNHDLKHQNPSVINVYNHGIH